MIHLLVERSGIPGGSDGKESTCHAGDPGSMPGYIYIYNPNYDSRDENDGHIRDEKCTGGINIHLDPQKKR